MSHKKTRKEKISSEARMAKERAELEKLKLQAANLQKSLLNWKQDRLKELANCNLRYLKHTCNFLAPYIITAGISIGLIKSLGGGFPFYRDEIKKYKVYDLELETNGYVSMNTKYRTYNLFDVPLPDNKLIIYTPWQEEEGIFTRIKKEFNLDYPSLTLFDAVLKEDYAYILANLQEYNEVTETTNELYFPEKNAYYLEASLHLLDIGDILSYSESDFENIFDTILILLSIFGIGSAIAYKRDFDYLAELTITHNKCQSALFKIDSDKQKLANLEQEIMRLTRKIGG